MANLGVGEPYLLGRTNWPEVGEFDNRGCDHELRVFVRAPKARETEAVRWGKYPFALVVGHSVFFLMYRFGKAIKWSHAPCSWELASDERQWAAPAAIETAIQAPLRVVLIEGQRGLVRGLCDVNLRPGFACHLADALRRLFPLASRAAYDQELAHMNRLYPTGRHLLQRAVACTGATPREKLVHRICLREQRMNPLLDVIYWFLYHSYEERAIRYAEGLLRIIEPELYAQAFMRDDHSWEGAGQ